MAVGFSGSNGGIAKAYRQFGLADVEAGLQKYRVLYGRAPTQVKPLYKKIVRDLEELRTGLRESKLVEKIEG